MSGREPAWRVLAEEFDASHEEQKGVGERAASYLWSPLGARMNRVLVAGVLSPAESMGKDPENPFYRARLEDPTGSVTVTAGTFQPRAMAVLRERSAPGPAVVVGKVHLFRGRDGTAYPSVRAEAIRALEPVELRAFLADAADHTTQRVRLLAPNESGGAAAPPPPAAWREFAREARRRYPQVDAHRFLVGVEATERVARGETELPTPSPARVPRPEPTAAPPPSIARVTRTSPPPPKGEPSASERAEESAFLDVVDQIAERSADGYAELPEVVRAAARMGVTSQRVEELLGRLEASGAIEEPIVGRLRRA